MKFRHLLAVAMVAGLATCSGLSASVVLYSQPFNGNNVDFYSSQYDPIQYGEFATLYDNFSLGTASAITEVSWVGAFFNGLPSPIDNFVVRFYDSIAGQPGNVLSSETFIGDAGQTDNGDGTNSYSVTLGSAFLAIAGVEYWVSVVPTLDFPPQWGWALSDVGDSISFQDFIGTRQVLDRNFAFEIRGTAVPEPSSWALCALGLGSILAARFRKRHNAG